MRKNRSHLMVLLILAVLLASSLIGSAVGKYIKTMSFPGTVTFSATLAESMVLQEHKVQRDTDGSYETTPVLLPAEGVKGNDYVLLPGLDIPKDPFITIEGKTDIPAYLFVEVLDTTENTLSYTMADHWLKLDDFSGDHGGAVYVYTGTDSDTPLAIDGSFGGTVNLLKGDTVTVSQKLTHGAEAGKLEFYACMGETAFSAETDPIAQAKAVYTAIS